MNPVASKAEVREYSLKAGDGSGRHVRWATSVVFPCGRRVDFTEPMTKRQAVEQARSISYQAYIDNWMKAYNDVEPVRFEDWVRILETGC